MPCWLVIARSSAPSASPRLIPNADAENRRGRRGRRGKRTVTRYRHRSSGRLRLLESSGILMLPVLTKRRQQLHTFSGETHESNDLV